MNFQYNANLTKHFKPTRFTALAWNAYGKVRPVTQGTTTMTFGYDAQQNRWSKTVTTNGVTKTSYYIRDAQGNALAVYERRGSSLVWKEQDLYGSSRLGMAKPEREMTGFFWQSASYTLVAGAKSYELSNHLGNVLAVISDRGELQSAQDFYPFGMAMPGRTWSASTEKYKYGFNGKETDPETGIQDYGMRWYLPNIARFPSVDPITKKYPWYTPYQFAGNTPIQAIDLDGLEPASVAKVKYTTTKHHYDIDGNPVSSYEVPTYKFTEAAVHFLSLVSGISKAEIQKVELLSLGEASLIYNPHIQGGGMTSPNGKDSYKIELSDNYFNPKYKDGRDKDVYYWLKLSSHEVGHIRDIKEIGDDPWVYKRTFAGLYLKHGSHDKVPQEIRADEGAKEFTRFAKFVGGYYGGASKANAEAVGNKKIEDLFNNKHNTDKDIIGKLDKWYKQYKKEEKSKK